MNNYIAKYLVNGCLNPEYPFPARSKKEAIRKATDYIDILKSDFSGGKVSLVELLRIEKVELIDLQGKEIN